ncbi:2-hydroxyacid dehydrogenase [Floridanema aerugineum]|uniref:2-hydroxyacid dehydrogenase n=1 Tax=Floridaenema aerugineum BLCC-F46 TaxID=3153654 RepID=A0ABV4X0G0_9CYAN
MKIANLTADFLDFSASEKKQIEALGEYIEFPSPKNESELIANISNANYAIISPLENYIISHHFFDASPHLKGISITTTWYHWIDTKLAQKRGIIVSNLGRYSKVPVGELAISLIFALARKIPAADRATKEGYGRSSGLKGFELKGKVLGIIGLGSIGSYIAQLGQSLGMQVIAYNRTTKETELSLVSLEELLQTADVIVICLALNAETENILNLEKLSFVKPNSIIVNIGREGLIDQEAIYQLALQNKIGGYAFEIDEPRKMPIKQELIKLDSVIATPYIGWYTPETMQRIKQVTIANIRAMIEGTPINIVV